MLTVNNLANSGCLKSVVKKTDSSVSYRGIGPYNIPSVTCTGSKLNSKFKNISFLSNNQGDTFVKTQVSSVKHAGQSERNFVSRFFGSINYGSLIDSSAFYNLY